MIKRRDMRQSLLTCELADCMDSASCVVKKNKKMLHICKKNSTFAPKLAKTNFISYTFSVP